MALLQLSQTYATQHTNTAAATAHLQGLSVVQQPNKAIAKSCRATCKRGVWQGASNKR
jgi:hypothetical protein